MEEERTGEEAGRADKRPAAREMEESERGEPRRVLRAQLTEMSVNGMSGSGREGKTDDKLDEIAAADWESVRVGSVEGEQMVRIAAETRERETLRASGREEEAQAIANFKEEGKEDERGSEREEEVEAERTEEIVSWGQSGQTTTAARRQETEEGDFGKRGRAAEAIWESSEGEKTDMSAPENPENAAKLREGIASMREEPQASSGEETHFAQGT